MPDKVLDAVSSDPATMGWMQGFPPPPERRILASQAGHMRFPMIRWSYSHMREFCPTQRVAADSPGAPFARALRDDIEQVRFTPLGGGKPMTFAEALLANYTDGILVLHKGQVVYERWLGVTGPQTRHIAFSMTKSFVGTLAEMLVEEGRLDPQAPVGDLIPELAGSGFADATVQQVMDMTTAIDFSEDYADPTSGIGGLSNALGLTPRPAGYDGPRDLLSFAATIGKAGTHGQGFTYRTVNTDVLGWLVARAAGKRLDRVLSERIWGPLGMMGDADFLADEAGTAFGGGGLNLRLEDLARFGEAMRLGGLGVIPGGVVQRIAAGADPERFDKARFPQLPGWSYRSQWWVSHDNRGCYAARGIHGQTLWIDPAAQMVVARFGSHPVAANGANDPTSLPLWTALGEHLGGDG
ncbi:MAG: serine hydrolase [Sphingomonadales bacterium]|nr:serine hydrolase [Sphingomonadales bacterium]MDE2568685.1 serine hydrolase [Sphingomonadales bacterium]